MTTIQQIQTILGVSADGQWGKQSQGALDGLIHGSPDKHVGKASSFADPADIRAFDHCKAQGKSDQECFKTGDNGIGCWGDNTREGSGACCAIQGQHMIEKWGSRDAAKHKDVVLTINDQTHTIPVKDRLTDNSPNGAVIDLNPDACALYGLTPPLMVECEWKWA